MAKTITKYVCTNCGRQSPRQMGRCPSCGEFNTMQQVIEEARKPAKQDRRPPDSLRAVPQRLTEVTSDVGDRLFVPVEEFSRVLGGGIVPGSVILVGGDPGIGKCLTADTRLFDPSTGAYLPIAEWAKGRRSVLSVDESSLCLTPDCSTAFHERGMQPIVEVKTKLGRTVRCTPSHPVLTPDGWRAIGELKGGDYIAAPRSLPYFGHIPMPEAKIKLIAYVLSDGAANSQVNVTNMLPEVAEDLQRIADYFGMKLVVYPRKGNRAKQFRFTNDVGNRVLAREEFAQALNRLKSEIGICWAEWARRADVKYSVFRVWRQGRCVPSEAELIRLAEAINIPIGNLAPDARNHAEMTTPIARFLEDVGLRFTRAADKSVPQCVFQLPYEQLTLFLKVLFTCDGSVYFNRRGQFGISYSTISHRLAEDIQHLLLRYGFVVNLRTKHSRVNNKPYTAYELQLLGVAEVQRFLTVIGIMGREDARQRILALETPQLPSTHRDVIPTGRAFWNHLKSICGINFAEITRRVGGKVKNRRHDRPLTRYLVAKIAAAYPDTRLQALAFGDVYWDKITSIMPAGIAPVYDISVSNHANFVANDLIVHNSTLLLQLSSILADTVGRVLYVSGEESARQIKMRADRLNLKSDDLYVLTETNLGHIFEHIQRLSPSIVVIDSIQTTYTDELDSSPGLVSQVRECASRLQGLAKSSGISVFLVGHVTKEGAIAGPRVLEHIVDTVLYLEGDPFQTFRLLRCVKNRFGATSEVGVFEMTSSGMVEVANPSEAFLAERAVNAPGSTIAVTMEGTRPLLVEIQALTSPTSFGNPRRTNNGVDINRLLLVSAVLSKRVGLRLHEQDIFVNVVGGIKIDEPASDLAMAVAMASSYHDKPVPADLAIMGEIGLSGEIRAVSQLAARLNEAAKIGFKRALIPRMRRKAESVPPNLQLLEVRNVAEALNAIMPKG